MNASSIKPMNAPSIETLVELFTRRGNERYSDEAVTQLGHAIQAAMLAEKNGAPPTLICAALLHDVGHLMIGAPLPSSNDQNLDDGHENKGYAWILDNFGPAVANPVRLHVAAKRYLCTVDPNYQTSLSPTSYKSFLDQGGTMSEEERISFESDPYFEEAVQLRKWDDLAKEGNAEIPSLESFIPLLSSCLLAK